jgi:HD domain protein
MDRLDYLCRDSFFTGVAEGKIASDRIIKMLDVREDRLMVQAKGIYSIENYLTSRRLMYWQVYLHKTAVACEKILINILKRAKTLQLSGENLFASPALHYFISNNIDKEWINNKKEETIFWYKQLDDSDIWSAIKVWRGHPDKVLSILSKDLINRETFKVKVYDEPIDSMQLEDIEKKIREKYQLSKEESHYFINYSTIRKDMYSMNDDQIDILYKDGSYKDITQASELFNVELLSKKICKYYLCHQRI